MQQAELFPSPRQLTLDLGGSDQAGLEDFSGEQNRLPRELVRALLRGDAEPVQLLVWGAPGCGRSHLLQAACHEAGALGGAAAYLPLNELADYGPGVLEGLERLPLVAVDDVQAVAGCPAWEEGLFDLINRAREQGARLLLSADGPPTALGLSLPDLVSRLGWGPVLRLPDPDDALKAQVLLQRAEGRGLELPEEVIRYLLTRHSRRLSDLLALFDRLDEASLSCGRRLSLPFVRAVLEEDVARVKPGGG
ncbi:MAG: DnaA regulatory inactivator Hda [Halothiobacillaceae bacterium]|nr:DnaA regulatory inactivator Hda [Halothiobacillaceae bacterium]